MRKSLGVILFTLLYAALGNASVGGGNITLKNEGGDVMFSHEIHVVGAGQKCTTCHDKLYTNVKQHKKIPMKKIEDGESCGVCHNGKTAFNVQSDCTKCHKK